MHGISEIKLFTDLTEEDIDFMLNTNLKSMFFTSQEVIKNMLGNKSGCIINMTSVWGVTGGSCEVLYSAAKAGVIGMTKALAKEMGPSNIRVNAIAPGYIETEMNGYLNEEEKEELKNEIPLKRLGMEEDVANTVWMLVNNEYITGQVITVDRRMDIKKAASKTAFNLY